jgi:hypothetical protein
LGFGVDGLGFREEGGELRGEARLALRIRAFGKDQLEPDSGIGV